MVRIEVLTHTTWEDDMSSGQRKYYQDNAQDIREDRLWDWLEQRTVDTYGSARFLGAMIRRADFDREECRVIAEDEGINPVLFSEIECGWDDEDRIAGSAR
jgi:hypothetical protein